MAMNARHRVPYRRRREGKTDYRARLALLKSRLPRAVVRKSLRNIQVQFIEFDINGDKVLTCATGRELAKFGWVRSCSNLPAAYLTGFLAGKRALANGIKKAVLDIGIERPTKGNKLFAALKGMVDAGVEIPHGEEVLPAEDRIRGAHINAEEEFEKVFNSLKEEFE